MKIYISADIEGVASVDHWDEATIGKPGYEAAALELTENVRVASEAALAAGATEIVVQDAHDSGRNIRHESLPEAVRLIRGWTDDPRCMAQELDKSFDALVLVGHHAPSSSAANPLSHTFSTKTQRILLNGEVLSEQRTLLYTAAYFGVPVPFVSGDAWVVAEARRISPRIEAVVTKNGLGNAATNVHPAVVRRGIYESVKAGLSGPLDRFAIALPRRFKVEIEYKSPASAHRSSFYPGAKKLDDTRITWSSRDFYEVLRFFLFAGYGY